MMANVVQQIIPPAPEPNFKRVSLVELAIILAGEMSEYRVRHPETCNYLSGQRK
jgi:hypothetical protein